MPLIGSIASRKPKSTKWAGGKSELEPADLLARRIDRPLVAAR